MHERNCPFCGRKIAARLANCPYCRENMPQAVAARNTYASEQGRKYMRRGFLYALMSGVIYFFAGGYSGMAIPIPIPPAVNQVLVPLLFIAGIGLVLYGLVLYIRS